MKKLLLVLLLIRSAGHAQDTLVLDDVLKAAASNYPVVRQYNLIDRSLDYSLAALNRAYLPQLTINGQAGYQSDVTALPFNNLPFPSVAIVPLDKDQYRLTGDVIQVVYDGGSVSLQKDLQRNQSKVESGKLDVEMQRLRERVRQLYLGILMVDGHIAQAELAGSDITAGTKRMEAAVRNGTAFRSQLSVMQVEELRNKQRLTELKQQRKQLLSSLAVLTGRNIPDHQAVGEPLVESTDVKQPAIRRPELELFSSQIALTDAQRKFAGSRSLPRLSLFAQGGYGRPGLNFLNNDFDWFYIAGARLNWNLGALYSLRAERSQLSLSGEMIAALRDAWTMNAALTVMQYQSDIVKYQRLLEEDDRIVALRDEIKTATKAQLDQGVITSSDYLREVNAAEQARLNRILHRLQLLQVKLELADYMDSKQR